jgi:hypothetical protein
MIWDSGPSSERALQRQADGRIAAAWIGTTNIAIEFELLDGRFHQLTCYFLDWDTNNERVQTVALVDAETGDILDVLTLEDFSQGKYVSFIRVRPLLYWSRLTRPPLSRQRTFRLRRRRCLERVVSAECSFWPTAN